MSSAYDNVAGGSLKFKGSGGITKKKKKKSSDPSKVKATLEEAGRESSPPPAAAPSKPITVVTKTAAELRFEQVQKKRQEEKIMKSAMKSHKQKVAELNQKLEEMTEHYDLPKVGPG